MPKAPKFYDVRLAGGPLVLCNACVAVLVQEGTVAGDPREEAVPASDVVRMAPRAVLPSDAKPPTCDTCASREAYEEALNESRVLHDVEVGPPLALTKDGIVNLGCHDSAFGTPEEHARWHAIHDTPTLAEVEGEDGGVPPFRPGVDGDLTKHWD